MNNFFNSPVAKRTRSQWQLFEQGFCRSSTSRDQPRKRNRDERLSSESGSERVKHDVIDVDVHKRASKKAANQNIFGGSEVSSTSTRSLGDDKIVDEPLFEEFEEEKNNENGSFQEESNPSRFDIESSLVEPKEEEGDEEGSGDPSIINIESSLDESVKEEGDEEESDEVMVIEHIDFMNTRMKNNYCASAEPFKSGTHTYFVYSSDDSDSDDTVVILEDKEEVDEDLHIFCKDYYESQNDVNACSNQSFEDDESDSDEPSSENESESESDSSEDLDFVPPNKSLNQPRNWKQSHKENMKEKVFTDDRKEKNHPLQKTNMKKMDHKVMEGSNGSDFHKKLNTKDKVSDLDMTSDKVNAVKGRRVSQKDDDGSVDDDPNAVKGRRVSQKDDVGSLDAILDSIVRNGSGWQCEEGDYCLPLRFRFDDSEDESSSQKPDESDTEALLQEMEFVLKCEEIGSYRTPVVDDNEKDDTETTDVELCERGEHVNVYLEEQTGLRCRLCGAVLLESRYVIPKLANYAPDKLRRSYFYDEEQQLSSLENMYFKRSEFDGFDICNQTKGTVWELIPISIRVHLYSHQQEGFEFMWKNLAGTIELSRLQKFGSLGHGGCIISHAPGTGKTLLTIVFIESFLKRFPKCCPVIVAPANMLLTWEAEFKKWRVGFSFISLNNFEFSSKDMVHSKLKHSTNLIRAMKISSWTNGGSVLGVSYNLYEKLAGNRKTDLEKMGNLLLDLPGLVVLDEGHTPRNQGSNIWNVLLKLKTKNRVILSGTPFQNNFMELFNTLRLVRPSIAIDIMKEKVFADMIHQSRRKCRGGGSASEGIEKLKAIISPFVHVHKGNILESKLCGLKKSIIILNPPPFQKRLLENMGNLAKTFEYEHKLALVSVHPSLILHCSLSEEEENSMNKQELEKVRLHPDLGVKTRFVMELIRLSVSLDEKVLIFSQYIQPLELLKDQISSTFGWDFGREVMVVKGRIHQNLRQTIINDFNDPKSKLKVLLASTKCCSEGIHLIGASRVVLLDVVWNPSVERQAISRAYRLGQKKAVYTYHLLASGTTEEEKYDRQVEKGRLAELVISSCAMDGEETKNRSKAETDLRMELNDRILQQMVDHQELKVIFKEIRYPDNHNTRI